MNKHDLLRGVIACALMVLSSCTLDRHITGVIAHPTYNNYKVQTVTPHWAVLFRWDSQEAWTCRKEGATFRCREVDYEETKARLREASESATAASPGRVP